LSNWRVAFSRELTRALQLLIGVGERCLSGGELGFALVDRGFERLALDREDHLAFFHFVAILEQAGPEKTLHASPQIDFFERLGATDKLGLLGHRAELRRLDQDRWRWSGLLGMRRQADQGCDLCGKDK
jgi:hypothetical protein